jgi:hypothetical protein
LLSNASLSGQMDSTHGGFPISRSTIFCLHDSAWFAALKVS